MSTTVIPPIDLKFDVRELLWIIDQLPPNDQVTIDLKAAVKIHVERDLGL